MQTFLLGIALGTIVLLTKSIYPAILCHIANNSMPLLLLYLTGIQNKDALPESVTTDVTALSLPPLAIATAGGVVVLGGILLVVSRNLRVRSSVAKITALILLTVSCFSGSCFPGIQSNHLLAQQPT